MNYNDLKTEVFFVEASAIKFYMRQSGWVNHGEIISYKTADAPEAIRSETNQDQQQYQSHRQRNWIDWVRSL